MTDSRYSPAALQFFESHGIQAGVALGVGVRESGSDLLYPNGRRRSLTGHDPKHHQPRGHQLEPWIVLAADGASILICEGESDALAAASALGTMPPLGAVDPGILSVPGTGCPIERVVGLLDAEDIELAYIATDADQAGNAYAEKLAAALGRSIEARRVLLSPSDDLAEHLVRQPAEYRGRILSELLRSATTWDQVIPGDAPDGVYTVTLSDVKPEKVKWLWQDRIPQGMLSLLVGDPGLGKSLLTLHIAAEVSRGGGDVLLLSAEDHAAVTIRPRAEAAGADLSRLHIVQVRRQGFEEGLVLPDDAAELDRMVLEHKAVLVIVDPVSAHLADAVNSWRDQSVRRALAPLARLAEQRGCASIVVAHLNKAGGTNPIHRTGGSIGLPAAARSALLLARDPEDPEGERGSQRVLAHIKSNVGELAETQRYEIETKALANGEAAPRLQLIGTSTATSSDLLAAPAAEERSELRAAIEFLEAELAEGAVPAKQVKAAAKEADISERTLERAKEKLEVAARKESFTGPWLWQLRQDRHGHTSDLAALAEAASESESPPDPDSEGRHVEGMAALEGAIPADDPPCPYENHRVSDWIGADGKTICGICHPPAGGTGMYGGNGVGRANGQPAPNGGSQ